MGSIPNNKQVRTYIICDKSVDEAAVDDDTMDATKRNEEEKPHEVGMIAVADTRVDPGTMVVHLHDASKRKDRKVKNMLCSDLIN